MKVSLLFDKCKFLRSSQLLDFVPHTTKNRGEGERPALLLCECRYPVVNWVFFSILYYCLFMIKSLYVYSGLLVGACIYFIEVLSQHIRSGQW